MAPEGAIWKRLPRQCTVSPNSEWTKTAKLSRSRSGNSQAGPAAAMGIFSGNGQSGAPGANLANPLVVRITDAGGNVKPGASVTFAVTSGGGSLTTTTVTTDANGLGTSVSG